MSLELCRLVPKPAANIHARERVTAMVEKVGSYWYSLLSHVKCTFFCSIFRIVSCSTVRCNLLPRQLQTAAQWRPSPAGQPVIIFMTMGVKFLERRTLKKYHKLTYSASRRVAPVDVRHVWFSTYENHGNFHCRSSWVSTWSLLICLFWWFEACWSVSTGGLQLVGLSLMVAGKLSLDATQPHPPYLY